MKEWLKDRWETSWLHDVWETLSEAKRRGGLRYFLEMYSGIMWAETKLRLGLGLSFRRSVVAAAEACDKEMRPEGESSEAVARFEKCRAEGDRAGMAFWRSVGVYAVVSDMHGPEKIRIVEG